MTASSDLAEGISSFFTGFSATGALTSGFFATGFAGATGAGLGTSTGAFSTVFAGSTAANDNPEFY